MDVDRYPHPLLAREGWFYSFLAVAAAIIATALDAGLWSVPFWVVAIFVIQFFRDPPRVGPSDPNAIASPADGRIVFVGPEADPLSGEPALKISVFMNVFNVHSNRAPIAGRVCQVQYFPGQFVNAALDKASAENERNAIVMEDDQGRRLTAVQIAGLVARRILCYVEEGDSLRRGARYGFIRFGSRVDVYLPLGSEPLVMLDQKVSAHSTALARWPAPA
ncbi:Psd Phosphatidylserine decarboxylase [Burkholderiales bacterium]